MDLEEKIIPPDAREFLTYLHNEFGYVLERLRYDRQRRKKKLDAGKLPNFLYNQRSVGIREDPLWRVAQAPVDLQIRYGEITGPASDRKGCINRANSGADTTMEDSEDSESPTWNNILNGQQNLYDRVRGDISFDHPTKGKIGLKEKVATLMYRPRGLHLTEKHFEVDGAPMSASLFDAGLFLYHNAEELIKKGSGPYFYLPKMESHKEAALWRNVFKESEAYLNVKPKSIKATALVENILFSFEIEESLYELKDYIVGLNAGRWDYIASCIAKLGKHYLFPDRDLITMTAPFMQAYTELLIRTCLKRGAQPIGGMSALIPSGKDTDKDALDRIRKDKIREASDGSIGAWIAHPAVVETVRNPFIEAQKKSYYPLEAEELPRYRDRLLNFKEIQNWKISRAGVEKNINVSIEYLQNWFAGRGAVGINSLMEDLATVEISLRQLNQWVNNSNAKLEDGAKIDETLIDRVIGARNDKATGLIKNLIMNGYDNYLTLHAYPMLD